MHKVPKFISMRAERSLIEADDFMEKLTRWTKHFEVRSDVLMEALNRDVPVGLAVAADAVSNTIDDAQALHQAGVMYVPARGMLLEGFMCLEGQHSWRLAKYAWRLNADITFASLFSSLSQTWDGTYDQLYEFTEGVLSLNP